jgi:hypothetical protein
MRGNDEGFEQHTEELFPSLRRRREASGPPLSVLAVLVVLLAAGAFGLWRLRSGEAPDLPASEASAAVPATAPGATASDPVLVLPALAASDLFVRELAGLLSSHPRWAAWLVSDELARRFVATIVDIGRGSSPAEHVEFMAPEGPFEVQRSGSRTVIAPASYRRYDLVSETFVSLDTQGGARLYRQLRPLFTEAYAELGISGYTFDQMMALAVGNLLAVDVPESAVEVRPHEAAWDFADPRLQARTPAEKHLLRMGPANARAVQGKVAALAQAIGIPLP